ncbi:MAG TPA: IPT/TIG domain-containing protein [Bryobacteraceae bacterium]|nr:IPT/TIG domain-containing protein [Bryobacteraceae bacterium]
MTTVEPDTGKKGDTLTVSGENLGKASVAKLYLTDGKNDVEVQIVDQTDTAIKFKIPAKTAAGRLALMVLTTTKPQQYVEQPVKVTVEDGTAQR